MAEAPIVLPLIRSAVASTCRIQVKTVRCVSISINRRVREIVECSGGVSSRPRPRKPRRASESAVRHATFRVDVFEVPDQQQPEVRALASDSAGPRSPHRTGRTGLRRIRRTRARRIAIPFPQRRDLQLTDHPPDESGCWPARLFPSLAVPQFGLFRVNILDWYISKLYLTIVQLAFFGLLGVAEPVGEAGHGVEPAPVDGGACARARRHLHDHGIDPAPARCSAHSRRSSDVSSINGATFWATSRSICTRM